MSSWGFKNNVILDTNKYIKLSTFNILGLDNNSNINFNTGLGDLYLNSNNSGSFTFVNVNNSKSVLVESNVGIGINSTSNINANLTITKNGFIGINTTQGSNDGFLGLAGSSVLNNTSGSRIILYGNEVNNGNLNLYSGRNGALNLFTGNDSNIMTIFSSGTTTISPNGSTIRFSVSDSVSNFTNQVIFYNTSPSTSTTTGSIIVNGGVGINNDVNIGGVLTSSGITSGNINVTGNLFQNGNMFVSSQWSGVSNNIFFGSSGSVLVGIGTTNPSSTLTVNGDIYVSGNVTLGNITNINNFSTSNLSIDYFNLASTSYMYSGTSTAANNIGSQTNVQGLVFPTLTTRSFSVDISVSTLCSTGGNLYTQYTLEGILLDSGWDIYSTLLGDTPVVTLSIDSNGQIKYTSLNTPNWISTTLRFQATGYSISSSVTPPSIPTSGNLLIPGILTVSNTTDSDSLTSGSTVIYGGVGIIKNVNIGGVLTSSGITTGNINFTGNLFQNGNLYVSSQWTGTSSNIFFGSSGSVSVGIGTTNPSKTLDVNGDARFNNITTGNINFTGSLFQNGSLYVSSQWSGTSSNIFFGSSGSVSVGIGTTNPSKTLDVNGDARFNNITTGNINFTGSLFQNGSLYVSSQWTGTSSNIFFGSSSSVLVGIGTTNPSSTLTVNGDLYVSDNVTLGNVSNINNFSTGHLSIDYFNLASTSYMYSGTSTAANNIITPTNVQGLLFPTLTTRSFTADISISTLRSTGGNLYTQYTLNGILLDSGWNIYTSLLGDTPVVTLSIDTNGQLTYTSLNTANWTSTTLRFQATGYSISSSVTPPTIPTSGNLLIPGILTVSNTTESNSLTSGSTIIYGGTSIQKTLNLGTNLVFNSISYERANTFSASNGPVSNVNIPDLIYPTSNYRSFTLIISISIIATTSLFAQYTIEGVQLSSGWTIYYTTLGDTMDITFDITSPGQIQYSTSTTHSGWTSTTFKYKSTAIST